MRNGSISVGEIVYIGEKYTTVRFETEPKMLPGAYGLQRIDFSYMDILPEYITPYETN